jgi:hypothetical protein
LADHIQVVMSVHRRANQYILSRKSGRFANLGVSLVLVDKIVTIEPC